jgi:hypothetical protein
MRGGAQATILWGSMSLLLFPLLLQVPRGQQVPRGHDHHGDTTPIS